MRNGENQKQHEATGDKVKESQLEYGFHYQINYKIQGSLECP